MNLDNNTKLILTKKIKLKGLELGFSKIGITDASDFDNYINDVNNSPEYQDFLDQDLSFHVIQGARPKEVYPSAKSIICAVYNYGDVKYPEKLSQYVGNCYINRCYSPLENSACGIRIGAFKKYLEEQGINVYKGEIAVPARRACARAGIVDFGRNNFAYTENEGSFILLYTFMVDIELIYDTPTTKSKCPSNCRKCIDSCPTHALKPGKLDPSRCILFSNMVPFWIPYEIRDLLGTRIHGCDICQKVCPRNKKVLENANRRDYFAEEIDKNFDLKKILLMDESYYKTYIYPMMHNYIQDIDYFRRNVAIAMGNSKDTSYIPYLKEALKYKNDQVNDAVQWALNKLYKQSEENKNEL